LLTLEKDAKLGDYPFVRTKDLLNLRNTCKEQDVWDFGTTFYAIMTRGCTVPLDIKGNLAMPIKSLIKLLENTERQVINEQIIVSSNNSSPFFVFYI
jgi:hypothetical protein